jgi:hypothetical protein
MAKKKKAAPKKKLSQSALAKAGRAAKGKGARKGTRVLKNGKLAITTEGGKRIVVSKNFT